MTDIMSFLNTQTSTGAPSVAWPIEGATVKGTIVEEPAVRTTTDMNTKESVDKLVLVIHTEVDTYVGDGDGGHRKVNDEPVALWVKAGVMAGALKTAVQSVGASSIEQGGRIQVTFTGMGEKGKSGFRAKLYDVTYKAPEKASGVSVDDL